MAAASGEDEVQLEASFTLGVEGVNPSSNADPSVFRLAPRRWDAHPLRVFQRRLPYPDSAARERAPLLRTGAADLFIAAVETKL